MEKPAQKPHYPYFSSGPCAKPPGWSFDNLKNSYACIWYTNDDKEKVKNFIMEDMNITKEDLDEFIKNIKP